MFFTVTQGPNEESALDARALDALLRFLREQLDLDFTQYKPNYLRRRIGVRMRATGCRDYMQYRQYVRQNPDECQKLINDLTINVTEFFRDPDVYEALRTTVIPEIIRYRAEAGSYNLRAWSAGCATGEEPYSMSILFHEALKGRREGEPWSLRITATDLDDKALARAKEGRYEDVKLLPGISLEEYFEKEEGLYRVRDMVRRPVRFLLLDIMQQPPLRHLDLVLCRNVLIYFEKERQKTVLQIISRCLRPGGFLVLGKSEAIVGESDFVPFRRRERVYTKRERHLFEARAASN